MWAAEFIDPDKAKAKSTPKSKSEAKGGRKRKRDPAIKSTRPKGGGKKGSPAAEESGAEKATAHALGVPGTVGLPLLARSSDHFAHKKETIIRERVQPFQNPRNWHQVLAASPPILCAGFCNIVVIRFLMALPTC